MLTLLLISLLLPYRVDANPMPCTVPSDVKVAMLKMGPYYNYKLMPDETLFVDKGDGVWLRLRYERKGS